MAGSARNRNAMRTPAPERLGALFPGLVRVDANDCRWFLPAGLHARLLDENGLRISEWLAAGQATIVKQGPHRVVYRVELDGLCFFVKHNLAPDWRTWFRQWLRPSKGRLEFERARAVAERGIGTVVPLGYAEPRSRLGKGESFLLTLALEGTEPLQQFLLSRLASLAAENTAQVRQDLARTLGEWVAQLHDAGICHNDFHAGNILVRAGDEQGLELFLVDLNAVQLCGPLSWRRSRENMVMLNRWFTLRVSRADRLRFWKAYYNRRFGKGHPPAPHCPQNFKILSRHLEQRTLLSNLHFWRRRDRRCLERNRYYHKVKVEGAQGHAVSDLDPRETRELMRDPDAPFQREGVKLLKSARSSTVIELDLTVCGERKKVIYKRFRVTRWHDPFRSLVRATEALRSWVHGHGLCERGLPTPRPLAVFHRTRFGMYYEGYLVTEKIENAQNLTQFLCAAEELPEPERRQRIRGQINHVARILREMHRRCLGHRDLKAHNVLVSRDPRELSYPGSGTLGLVPHLPSSIWIIDLVGVDRHYSRLRWSRRVQNLARINVSFFDNKALSRTDRLRFLREYMQWNLHGKDHWKKLWNAIGKATLAKVKRNRQRGRPLS